MYHIVEPHQDIRDGNFDEVVFAAKFDDVVFGTAPMDYGDSSLFFKNTYCTEGIKLPAAISWILE